MKLIYSGSHPVVDVEEDGVIVLEGVKQGEPVEVPDDVAGRLLEQSTWSAATASPPSSSVSPASPISPPAPAPSASSTGAPAAQESDD